MNLVDLHCDTLSKLLKGKGSLVSNNLQVDLAGMKMAGTMVQFFACFVNAAAYEEHPLGVWDGAYEDVLRMISRMEEETGKTEGIRIVRDENQRKNATEKGIISAALTVEEGGVLKGNLERLEELYERGIRLMTLTWNYENCIGFPNSADPEIMQKGLKPFGLEVVERMNELGMIVDVSHLSDGGFWDCIHHSRVQVIASHSNARALCSHRRNLTDEMLRALAEKGGVAGLNFYPLFLRNDPRSTTLEDLARHAAYMIRIAGEDVVAVGTDFDGFTAETEDEYISHVREMERVWECLKRYGITERQLDKIWSGNALRVIRNVW